jgi:hypothetical protein
VITEREGFAGGTYFAVEIVITFPGREPVTVVTTEEVPYRLQLPSGAILTLVTSATDETYTRARIRVLRNATGGRGALRGDLLDDVELPIGGATPTTRLDQNFEIRVVRIGMNKAPR